MIVTFVEHYRFLRRRLGRFESLRLAWELTRVGVPQGVLPPL